MEKIGSTPPTQDGNRGIHEGLAWDSLQFPLKVMFHDPGGDSLSGRGSIPGFKKKLRNKQKTQRDKQLYTLW